MKIIKQLVEHFYGRLTPDEIEHIIAKGLISEYYRKLDPSESPHAEPAPKTRVPQSSRCLCNISPTSHFPYPNARKILKKKKVKARRCFDKAIITEQI